MYNPFAHNNKLFYGFPWGSLFAKVHKRMEGARKIGKARV
jgi:hypothetical protein